MNKQCDIIIIGSDLTAQIVAYRLAQENLAVLWLDSRRQPTRALAPDAVAAPLDLGYFPDTPDTRPWAHWMNGFFQREILRESPEQWPAVTWDNGALRPFVGFGDRGFRSASELGYFLSGARFQSLEAPEHWSDNLQRLFAGERWLGAEVDEIQLAEGRAHSLIVNGDKSVTGGHIILTDTPLRLLELLPNDFKFKARHRLERSRTWGHVSLHLTHQAPVHAGEEMHFLFGAKDDFEPCIGRFFAPISTPTSAPTDTPPAYQHSLWMSLIPTDLSHDDEQTADILRFMKKQITRPYPSALTDLKSEKIMVKWHSFGHVDLGLEPGQTLPELGNLVLASPLLSHLPMEFGQVAAAARTLNETFRLP